MNRALLGASLFALAMAGCAAAPKPIAEKAAAVAEPKKADPSADPPLVVDGDVTFAVVRGMQILVKRIPTAELVAGHLYIKGGVRNWTADNAGVEQLALSVSSTGGTESLGKDAFARKLATLGSGLGAGASNDYSGWTAKSLLENWDVTFDLLVDAFLRPALPASEIDLHRARQLSALRHEQESPDSRLSLALHHLLFKGHPYENRAIGTPESLAKLKREDLVKHLHKMRETRRLLLVVVGNVPAEHVIEQARGAFSQIPPGSYQEAPLPRPTFADPRVASTEVNLPTNYIEGVFAGPGWNDPDFPAALVSMSVLSWRLFEEVRTKRNLSYSPNASFAASSSWPHGLLYVTATDPATTIKVMFDEVKRLKQTLVPSEELAGDKSTFLTGLLMQNETTDGQADLLGRAQLYGGDWKIAKMLPERVRAVSSPDIQTFAKKYIRNLQVVALGDTKKLDPSVLGAL